MSKQRIYKGFEYEQYILGNTKETKEAIDEALRVIRCQKKDEKIMVRVSSGTVGSIVELLIRPGKHKSLSDFVRKAIEKHLRDEYLEYYER